jgi:hypothetical protein
MTAGALKKYFRFVLSNRPVYFNFNRQLVIGELAGFAAGVGVAEAAATATRDELAISVSSGVADYAGSILGFLAIFYRDSRAQSADVAYILVRPYIHYVLLVSGLEAGVAATIAHFAAFGVFNGVAILSRSIIDYLRSSRQ